MPPVVSQSSPRTLRVFYVFAGKKRRSDVRRFLETLCKSNQVDLQMYEWDIARDPNHDILNSEVAAEIFKAVQDLRPHCVICTPPCNTFSRARHNYQRSPGPRPIRDATYPLGFPWLSDKNKRIADEANTLIEFTWLLFEMCVALYLTFLGEHPEDLGVTPIGRPASIWQSPEFSQCLQWAGVWTFALYQCLFGAASSKPTRFVTNLSQFPGNIYQGIPIFDKKGHYVGPLPHRCPHDHEPLVGQLPSGQWATSPAANYPPDLCEAIATAIFLDFQASSASGGNSFDGLEMDFDENHESIPPHVKNPEVVENDDSTDLRWSKLKSGCSGPPLTASLHGKASVFVGNVPRGHGFLGTGVRRWALERANWQQI